MTVGSLFVKNTTLLSYHRGFFCRTSSSKIHLYGARVGKTKKLIFRIDLYQYTVIVRCSRILLGRVAVIVMHRVLEPRLGPPRRQHELLQKKLTPIRSDHSLSRRKTCRGASIICLILLTGRFASVVDEEQYF